MHTFTEAVFPGGPAAAFSAAHAVLQSAADFATQMHTVRERMGQRLEVEQQAGALRERTNMVRYDELAAAVDASYELPALLAPFDKGPALRLAPVAAKAPMPGLPSHGSASSHGIRHR